MPHRGFMPYRNKLAQGDAGTNGRDMFPPVYTACDAPPGQQRRVAASTVGAWRQALWATLSQSMVERVTHFLPSSEPST